MGVSFRNLARNGRPALYGRTDAFQLKCEFKLTHYPTSIGLDDLCIEQVGQRPPAGLRRGVCIPLVRGLHPVAKVGQQRRAVILKRIGEKEGHAALGQHLNDLMGQTLRHCQGTLAHVDH
jgi:hypothetical protein